MVNQSCRIMTKLLLHAITVFLGRWADIFFFIVFIHHHQKHIWAATCDFRQCGILTWIDLDESVQPPFKLRNSIRCSVSSLIHIIIEYSSYQQRLWSDCPTWAGWSEPLLVAHTTLLEISCHGSYVFGWQILKRDNSKIHTHIWITEFLNDSKINSIISHLIH